MAVAVTGRKAGAVAGPELLLTAVVHEYDLATQYVDELVLVRVPVTLARPATRRPAHEVDTELPEPFGAVSVSILGIAISTEVLHTSLDRLR